MLLNKAEIKELNLITDTIESNFSVISYDLSIKEIITLDNEIVSEYKLPPQGMVVVVCKEQFSLEDKCVVGFTTVKNALSRKGIMAVNVGLVDPGYVGAISSILINFGKSAITIKEGDAFLRMTFHKFTPLDPEKWPNSIKNRKTSHEEYVEARRNEANTYLDPTFLYLKDIQLKALEYSKNAAVGEAKILLDNFKANFETTLKIGGIFVAIAGIIVAVTFNIINYTNSKANSKNTVEQIKSLETKIEKLEDSISSMKDTLKKGR